MFNGIEEKTEIYWDLNEIRKIKSSREAVREFEVYLVQQFLKEAKRSLPEGLFSPAGNFSTDLYYDLFYMEISQKVGEKLGKNIEPLFEKALKAYGGG